MIDNSAGNMLLDTLFMECHTRKFVFGEHKSVSLHALIVPIIKLLAESVSSQGISKELQETQLRTNSAPVIIPEVVLTVPYTQNIL